LSEADTSQPFGYGEMLSLSPRGSATLLAGRNIMQINGLSHVHGPQSISSSHATSPVQQAGIAAELTGSDEVSISREADLLSRIGELPEVRQERIDQIRTEIAGGAYETQEKLDLAIARLLDEIA